MSLRRPVTRLMPMALSVSALAVLAGCSGGSLGPLSGFSSVRTQGYEISESALQQVRAGQSVDLVVAVLGSPQTQGTFENETVYYYVETKVERTTFGLETIQERTVLAVYFDGNMRVKDKAIYGLQDGRVFTIESRRTPSFGQDRTFVEQILGSFTG